MKTLLSGVTHCTVLDTVLNKCVTKYCSSHQGNVWPLDNPIGEAVGLLPCLGSALQLSMDTNGLACSQTFNADSPIQTCIVNTMVIDDVCHILPACINICHT